MRLNDRIRTSDGRVGTICYRSLDGEGGVWGEHAFTMPDGGFGGELPAPQFMLREKSLEPILRRSGHRPDVECVGAGYTVLGEDED